MQGSIRASLSSPSNKVILILNHAEIQAHSSTCYVFCTYFLNFDFNNFTSRVLDKGDGWSNWTLQNGKFKFYRQYFVVWNFCCSIRPEYRRVVNRYGVIEPNWINWRIDERLGFITLNWWECIEYVENWDWFRKSLGGHFFPRINFLDFPPFSR